MTGGPDIASLLAQAGGGQGGPPPGGPADVPTPGDTPDPSAQGGGGADHGQAIRDILDQVRAAAQSSDDQEESLTWEKISTLIQQILAKQQKQDQELLQGKLPPQAMIRALSGP